MTAAVFEMTEGNPFFVGEIVRLLAAEGRLDTLDPASSLRIALPQGVREAIGRRLDALSTECNRVLTVASAVGRSFALPVLERVADLARDRLLEVLEEAVASRILTPPPLASASRTATPVAGGRALGEYAFSHALIRETLYEELTTPARVQLHRRIGEVLEELHAASPEAHLAELAHHFFQAAPGGDIERAVRYATRAAERSAGLLAYEQAAADYERALQALDLSAAPDETRRLEVLLALGEASSRAGERARARAVFLRAADLARSLDRPAALAHAALGFGGRGEMGLPGDEALRSLLEEALAAVGDSDPALRARLLGRLVGTAPYTDSRRRAPDAQPRRARSRAAAGDRDTLLDVLAARAWAMLGPDHVEERARGRHRAARARRPDRLRARGLQRP